MATIKRKSFDKVITPTGGKAKWCKINSQVDEYEGKRRYTVTVTFEDKAKEKKLKDFLDDLIAKTKEDSEFAGCSGNGSEIRIQFTPTVYWMNAESNGINLYINRIVVDNLIEYQGESDFSDFDIEVAKDMDDMEVPI